MLLRVPANMPEDIQHRHPFGRVEGFRDDIAAEFGNNLIRATQRRVLAGLDDQIGHVVQGLGSGSSGKVEEFFMDSIVDLTCLEILQFLEGFLIGK